MSAAPQDAVPSILRRLRARVDELADRFVAVFVATMASYAALPEPVIAQVRGVVRTNLVAAIDSIQEGRPPTDAELGLFADSARRRAREGLPLDDLLHAYRAGVGQWWEVISEEARDSGEPTAALDIASGVLNYLDVVSTAVVRSYLDEQQVLQAGRDERQRRLIHALVHTGTGQPAARTAEHGERLADCYGLARLRDTGTTDLPALAETVRRLRPGRADVLAAPDDGSVAVLWPDPSEWPPQPLLDLVRRTPGLTLAVDRNARGADGVVDALLQRLLHNHPRATGILNLEVVILSELVLTAAGDVRDHLARHAAVLREHPVLLRTLDAYLACNASLTGTAKALFLHRNTVTYRLGKVHELTGLDPRHIDDLILLRLSRLGASCSEPRDRGARPRGA